jgi:hypothetical protein
MRSETPLAREDELRLVELRLVEAAAVATRPDVNFA